MSYTYSQLSWYFLEIFQNCKAQTHRRERESENLNGCLQTFLKHVLKSKRSDVCIFLSNRLWGETRLTVCIPTRKPTRIPPMRNSEFYHFPAQNRAHFRVGM